MFCLSIHTICGPVALNHCLGEIAAYDYFKLSILHACTLMILGAHNCTDGSGDSSQLTQKWPQESSSLASLRPFWLMELHNNILPWMSHVMHTLYLGKAKEQDSCEQQCSYTTPELHHGMWGKLNIKLGSRKIGDFTLNRI